jgi:hypothetical protein
MLFKAAPGLKVRDPRTRVHIPEEGIEVDAGDLTFVRLLRDGDVVEVKTEEAAAPAPEAPKAPEPKAASPAPPSPPAPPAPPKPADEAKGD